MSRFLWFSIQMASVLLQSIAGWKGYETDHEIQQHMLSPHTNDCKILSWCTCKLRIYSMELVFEPMGSEERWFMWICTSLKLCAPAVPCQVLIKAVWDSRGWCILSHSIQPCSTKVFIHCNGCLFIWIWQMTLCLLEWLGSYNLFIFMLNYKSHGVCLNDILHALLWKKVWMEY